MKKLLKGLIFIIVLISCSQDHETVKIGVILPLTGPASEIGKDIYDGIQIALKLSTENNFSYKLIVEDSKIDPKTGISAALKLIEVDKVSAIIGVAASPIALAIAPICEKNKIIMLSSTASTPLLTNAGEFIFRIYPSDLYDGNILAKFAFNKKNIKSFSILYLNNDFGLGLKDVFVEKYSAFGGQIKEIESFLPTDKDFKTQLLSIKQSKSKGLLVVAIDMQYKNIIKQIKELNIDSEIFAPVTFDNQDILNSLGDASNGIIYSRPFYDPSKNDIKMKIFIKKYQELRGKSPSLLTALGYDTYNIIANSLQKNDQNLESTKDYLYKLNYNGVSGNIKFDKNGDVIKDLEIMVVKNKRAVKYEEN